MYMKTIIFILHKHNIAQIICVLYLYTCMLTINFLDKQLNCMCKDGGVSGVRKRRMATPILCAYIYTQTPSYIPMHATHVVPFSVLLQLTGTAQDWTR